MVVLDHTPVRVRAGPFGGRTKRASDIVIALVAVILFAPLILLICLAVKIYDGGPAFFTQKRIGFGGAPFPFVKIRTMAPDASEKLDRILAEDPDAAREWREKQKLTNDPRVTPIGRFLRRTSLDELPQFFNVLAAEMSIVGPRPMLERQIGEYGERFALYCTARPGITGLWQVSGRNRLTFLRRAQLDELYLQRWSIFRDFSLLARTAAVVVSGAGAA